MKTKSAYSFNRCVFSMIAALALVATAAAETGSLWKAARGREAGMFGDRRARRVGDILTVIVQESAKVQASTRTTTDKTASVESAIQSFFYPNSGMGTHNGSLPSVNLGGTTNFDGGGAISNSQTINARAAVTVIDVLPNGNLVIEGARYLSYSGEKQYAVLRGIVRPEDIQSGNTVLSSSVADARVEFIAQGSISSAANKGWLTRMVDKINPF